MNDWPTIAATLRAWQGNAAGVTRVELEGLLANCGYVIQDAVDYPGVLLYYKKDWPRFMGVADGTALAADTLQRICSSLLNKLKIEDLI